MSRGDRLLLIALFCIGGFLALLTGCDGGGEEHPLPVVGISMSPWAWDIAYSPGMAAHPMAQPDGWSIDIPGRDGLHYVTTRYGSLRGKTVIRMRYRVEAEPGARIVPSSDPALPSIGPTLFFQRCNDNMSGTGPYEAYRWWATFAAPMPVEPGEHVVEASLSGRWTAVMTSTRDSNPDGFIAAANDACRVGFTMGGGTGYGHGVYAEGAARLVVTSFEVL